MNGELSDDDIRELAEICKAAHGLTEQQGSQPLTEDHVPDKHDDASPVSLLSIFHNRGVNALAERQTLSFGPNLTVVYGDNAAGKTGYIRILKSACRARGQEKILGNVVSGTMPPTPALAIKYRVGAENEPLEWTGHGRDEFVSRVSVFDAQCAAVYLTEKTDVAFRPFGLDLFDQLVRACKSIRVRLEREQQRLASNPQLESVLPQIPEGTAVAGLLSNITSLTKPETVKRLAHLTPKDESRLALLERSLLDLKASDPTNLTRRLTRQVARLEALGRHLEAVESALSVDAVSAAFAARSEGRRKEKEAKTRREAALRVGMLAGTGSETWGSLWEAARRFSQESAYPDQLFPVVENGARCVLCQQHLDDDARQRFQRFEEFVASTTEQELRQSRETVAQIQRNFTNLKVLTESVRETIEDVRIDHEAESGTVTTALAAAEERRLGVVLALSEDRDLAEDCPVLQSVQATVHSLLLQIRARVETLRASAVDEKRKLLSAEAGELRARKVLAQHLELVLDEIERKSRYAAYGLCIDDTRTQAITRKSTTITRIVVTQKLKQSFRDELSRLGFRHVEVELKEAGGAEGVLYHKLVLTRAPGVELPRVVSEGEQRCLSIAAFFAELSTADDPSGIVFDDPVSSLDYKWREGVARRLVEEATMRQVVVFTHDIVFLLLLKQFAEQMSVAQLDQHVRNLPIGTGVCAEELPWVALKVSKRVGHLKKLLQEAKKLHRDGHQAAYEKEASIIYGLLREAWERGLEEVLLGGVVERFRPGVQTLQIRLIADVTERDCRAVETAMTKCSRWLPGHDQAAAAVAMFPEPEALEADIAALGDWLDTIRRRRNKS